MDRQGKVTREGEERGCHAAERRSSEASSRTPELRDRGACEQNEHCNSHEGEFSCPKVHEENRPHESTE